MVRSVEGVYRDGKIELLGPAPTQDESRVIVTFVAGNGPVDLAERDIDPAAAEDLRRRLSTFEEDWRRDDMDVYDDV